MALDPRFVTSISLEEYFVDKDTGAPLAGGLVYFYEDNDRTTPKIVYELTGAPPNYTYTPLPNPIVLSATGTIVDSSGNNIALYYFPYDSMEPEANIQLYYVACFNSLGVEQFTREGWPNTTFETDALANQSDVTNEISNPQFVQVLFDTQTNLTISLTGSGSANVKIAPDWYLNVSYSATTSVAVTQNPVAGSSAYPYNPPFTLSVTPGSNISSITLSQRLYNNPDIWSPSIAGSTDGYIGASILLAPLTSVTMVYQPSTGIAQTLLSANNTSGSFSQFSNTTQLTPASNTDTGAAGYVDIILQLPISGTSTISNVQVVGLGSNTGVVPYDQQSVNRQRDQLFHYYNPLLQYKPIPSYLIGWDFPYNPAQFLGTTVAASSAGVNTSQYVWDQTILFQSANSGAAVSQATSGALRITATNATQFAIVQYLPANVARKVLNDRFSVNVASSTTQSGGIIGTVSVWYTTSTLPSTGSNNSIVATLSSTGSVLTQHGTWTQVPRNNLGDAQFTSSVSSTTNYGNAGFSGWDMQGIAAADTATYVAIVVGFGLLMQTNTVDIYSVSLCAGDIPTRPSPKTLPGYLEECQYFYFKTFLPGVVPAQNAGVNTGEFAFISQSAGALGNGSPTYSWPVQMYAVPTVTIYSPGAANNQVYDETSSLSCSSTTTHLVSNNGLLVTCTGNSSSGSESIFGFHATADARLGL